MLCLVVPNSIWGPPAVGHQGFKQENLGIWSAVPPGGEPDFWQAGRAIPVPRQTVESKDTSVAVSSLNTSYAVRATMKSHKKNKESIFSPGICVLDFCPSPGEYLSSELLPIILTHSSIIFNNIHWALSVFWHHKGCRSKHNKQVLPSWIFILSDPCCNAWPLKHSHSHRLLSTLLTYNSQWIPC